MVIHRKVCHDGISPLDQLEHAVSDICSAILLLWSGCVNGGREMITTPAVAPGILCSVVGASSVLSNSWDWVSISALGCETPAT
mmetsp:Transcript_14416/g.31249  ORF Transcript_14416/g.31249 Transcript_14416/m.31249 type:complete len:84 (+) Transcript_14416:415-666(+)